MLRLPFSSASRSTLLVLACVCVRVVHMIGTYVQTSSKAVPRGEMQERNRTVVYIEKGLLHGKIIMNGGSNLPLWRGAGGGSLLAGTRRRPVAEDGVPPSLQIPPHTHLLLARSPAPYSPFRRRAHSLTAFSGRWRARLLPPRVLLPHTYTQDGWFLQPERRPARLPRRTIFSRCIWSVSAWGQF